MGQTLGTLRREINVLLDGGEAAVQQKTMNLVRVAAVDRGLNEMGYIVPGLGYAGDKLFGTS